MYLRKENLQTTCAKTQKHKLDNFTAWKQRQRFFSGMHPKPHATSFTVMQPQKATQAQCPIPALCLKEADGSPDPIHAQATRTELNSAKGDQCA